MTAIEISSVIAHHGNIGIPLGGRVGRPKPSRPKSIEVLLGFSVFGDNFDFIKEGEELPRFLFLGRPNGLHHDIAVGPDPEQIQRADFHAELIDIAAVRIHSKNPPLPVICDVQLVFIDQIGEGIRYFPGPLSFFEKIHQKFPIFIKTEELLPIFDENTSIFGDLEIVRRFEVKRAALVGDPPDLPELEDSPCVLGEGRGGILDNGLGGDRFQGRKACACEEDQLERLSSINLMFQDTACFLGSIHW